MKYELVLSERSLFQIEKIAKWFSDQKEGLEIEFLLELDSNLNYIQKNPLKCQIRYRFIRIKFLKKFQFGIHYIIENNTVFILNIFHTSQSDENWF